MNKLEPWARQRPNRLSTTAKLNHFQVAVGYTLQKNQGSNDHEATWQATSLEIHAFNSQSTRIAKGSQPHSRTILLIKTGNCRFASTPIGRLLDRT